MGSMGDKAVNDRSRRQAKKAGKLASLGTQRMSGEAEITGIDAAILLRSAVALLRSGGAMMLACTSDGGALVITVMDGDERHKEYLHTADEINYFLQSVEVTYAE